MKRKVTSLLVILALVMAMFPTAFATDYYSSGSCGENLTFVLDKEGTLTISGIGEMYDYDYFDNPPPWNGPITSIVIENGATSIGTDAFEYRHELTNVQIPNTVTRIGDSAFMGCEKLENIDIPESVTSIEGSAFRQCSALQEISLSANVTSIGIGVFVGCTSLDKIIVDENNPSYCSDDFGVLHSKDMQELIQFPLGYEGAYSINESVTRIAPRAFAYSAAHLTSVNVPDSVTEIGYEAFDTDYTTKYQLTVRGNHGAYIETYAQENTGWMSFVFVPNCAFEYTTHINAGCENGYDLYTCPICGATEHRNEDNNGTGHNYVDDICLKCGRNRLVVSGACGENLTWKITDDGVMTIMGDGEMQYYYQQEWLPYRFDVTDIVFDGNITSIADSAFYNFENLTEIVIPDSVTAIHGGAFSSCHNLSSITIPDSVKYIGLNAFGYTAWRNNVEGYAVIGDGHLVYLKLPEDLEMGASVDLIIPEDVKRISSGFYGWNEIDLEYNFAINIDSITFPYGLEKIGTKTFYRFNGSELHIPSTVTLIGDEYIEESTYPAFQNSPNLTSVYFYGNAPEIEPGSFKVYTGGRSVNVTPTLYYIEGKTGWTDSDAYDPDTNTWNGYPLAEFTPTPEKCVHEWINGKCTLCASVQDSPFVDAEKDRYYYTPMMWAVENSITSGITSTTFVPDGDCTRGQVVTFLWRLYGCPEPESSVNPFVDVAENRFYYKAALWAAENGITTGVDAAHFAPDATCTRSQVVTFLWRAAGKPAASSTSHGFTDLKQTAFYYDAVLWAVESGITNGITTTTFEPNTTCNRGQVVTFLYRFAK